MKKWKSKIDFLHEVNRMTEIVVCQIGIQKKMGGVFSNHSALGDVGITLPCPGHCTIISDRLEPLCSYLIRKQFRSVPRAFADETLG